MHVDDTSPGDLVEKIVGRSMADAFVKPLPADEKAKLPDFEEAFLPTVADIKGKHNGKKGCTRSSW